MCAPPPLFPMLVNSPQDLRLRTQPSPSFSAWIHDTRAVMLPVCTDQPPGGVPGAPMQDFTWLLPSPSPHPHKHRWTGELLWPGFWPGSSWLEPILPCTSLRRDPMCSAVVTRPVTTHRMSAACVSSATLAAPSLPLRCIPMFASDNQGLSSTAHTGASPAMPLPSREHYIIPNCLLNTIQLFQQIRLLNIRATHPACSTESPNTGGSSELHFPASVPFGTNTDTPMTSKFPSPSAVLLQKQEYGSISFYSLPISSSPGADCPPPTSTIPGYTLGQRKWHCELVSLTWCQAENREFSLVYNREWVNFSRNPETPHVTDKLKPKKLLNLQALSLTDLFNSDSGISASELEREELGFGIYCYLISQQSLYAGFWPWWPNRSHAYLFPPPIPLKYLKKKMKLMANTYKHKTGKVPIRGPETPGNFWLLSQGESTEGRSQKALGQTKEHSSTPGTPPPLMDTGWKESNTHLGQCWYRPRFSAPGPIPFLLSLWEGAPAHLSSKASPSRQGRRNSDEGRVESLAEKSNAGFTTCTLVYNHYPMFNLELLYECKW